MQVTAVLHGKTIVISSNIANALTGIVDNGWHVKLHAVENRTFLIETETGDSAIRMAINFARRNGIKVNRTGATFQKAAETKGGTHA